METYVNDAHNAYVWIQVTSFNMNLTSVNRCKKRFPLQIDKFRDNLGDWEGKPRSAFSSSYRRCGTRNKNNLVPDYIPVNNTMLYNQFSN